MAGAEAHRPASQSSMRTAIQQGYCFAKSRWTGCKVCIYRTVTIFMRVHQTPLQHGGGDDGGGSIELYRAQYSTARCTYSVCTYTVQAQAGKPGGRSPVPIPSPHPQSLGRVVKIEHRTYCMCGPSIENTSRTYILTVLASDPRRDQYPRNIQRDGYEDSFSVRKGTFPASDRPVA
jgi:hypothetical protein